jgi:hypothetical protein
LTRRRDELAVELGGPTAHHAPSLENGRDDRRDGFFAIEETADVSLEGPARALGHHQAERLHDAADFVREPRRHAEKLAAHRRGRGQASRRGC